jgi:hypothetical protein
MAGYAKGLPWLESPGSFSATECVFPLADQSLKMHRNLAAGKSAREGESELDE